MLIPIDSPCPSRQPQPSPAWRTRSRESCVTILLQFMGLFKGRAIDGLEARLRGGDRRRGPLGLFCSRFGLLSTGRRERGRTHPVILRPGSLAQRRLRLWRVRICAKWSRSGRPAPEDSLFRRPLSLRSEQPRGRTRHWHRTAVASSARLANQTWRCGIQIFLRTRTSAALSPARRPIKSAAVALQSVCASRSTYGTNRHQKR